MNIDLLISNLTSPALLFFCLGILAVQLKSDLEIPPNSSKFISLYLLFAIGFKGGQELAHSTFNADIIGVTILGVVSALIIPLFTFFLLKRRLGVPNAAAIAAAYGSVSAVTFVTAVSYLEMQHIHFGGHMVAVMALMEAPAIVVGVYLLSRFSAEKKRVSPIQLFKHALTNGSVLLILGSLVIGFLASEQQAQGIAPFTTDIFKGFLAVFLLDMGITTGKHLSSIRKFGLHPLIFALVVPLLAGIFMSLVSGWVTSDEGNRLLLSILAASASYIAVPAAMKITNPKANPGLYLPMALAVTFPLNITLGMPLYHSVINL